MMRTTDCPHQENLGAYILGGLELEEHQQFAAHLDGCDSCQRELAPLSGLPGQLNIVDPAQAFALLDEALAETAFADEDLEDRALLNGHGPGTSADDDWGGEPPAELLATVHHITARRRRTWRVAGLSAAAVLLVAVGAAAGTAAARHPQPPQAADQTNGQTYGQAVGQWRTISSPVSQGPGAVVMYRQMGWGTQLQAKVTGLPAGVPCQMTVLTADGSAVVAGSWDTDAKAGIVVYPSSADVPASDIRQIVITDGDRPPIIVQA
jgi:Putative zinc-finger